MTALKDLVADSQGLRAVTAKCPAKAIGEDTTIPSSMLLVQMNAPPVPKSQRGRPTLDRCECSGCHPEIAVTGTATQGKQRKKATPLTFVLPKLCGSLEWVSFMLFANELTAGIIPLESFLPESVMEDILDQFSYLLSKSTIESLRKEDGSFDLTTLLKPFVTDNIYLIGESSRLLETCLRIHSEFDRIHEEKKVAKEKN